MSVTPASASSNTIFAPSAENNAVKLLEKQKMQLQEQIQKVNESKLDDKTKQERIKSLQDQIQQIDMEILQRQSEKLNQKQNRNQETTGSQANTDSSENSYNSAGMSQILQASTTFSQAKIMNNVKDSLNGKSNILKIEIKLDESRGGDSKRKSTELHEAELKGQRLDKKVGETLQTTQKQVKEASAVERKNGGKNNKDDNKEASDTQENTINNNVNNQEAVSANNDKKEDSQQGIKGIDKRHKTIDIRV